MESTLGIAKTNQKINENNKKNISVHIRRKKTKQNPVVGKMLPPIGKCFSEILPSTECYFQLLPYLQGLAQQIAAYV